MSASVRKIMVFGEEVEGFSMLKRPEGEGFEKSMTITITMTMLVA